MKSYLCLVQDTNSNVLFASILDSQQDTPDVIWNLDMRQRLLDHLTSELEPYVKSRANDPMAPYVHTPRAPIYYPELTGKFRVRCTAEGRNERPIICTDFSRLSNVQL